jgi:hypothetical protein
MTPHHPLLEAITDARFEDASKLLEELRMDSELKSQKPDEVLGLIESARINALVHRAHLMKSLVDLNARRLFMPEGERAGSTWYLEA